MEEQGCQRARKLKLAFRKALTEALKEKDKIRDTILSSESHGRDSLSFVEGNPEEDNGGCNRSNEEAFEKLFERLRHVSYEAFKSKLASSSVNEKLESLERAIKDNRVNLRDIRSEEYIREIYESHLVESKLDLYSKLEAATLRARERKNSVRAENEKLVAKLDELRRTNNDWEQRLQSLIGGLNAVSEQKGGE